MEQLLIQLPGFIIGVVCGAAGIYRYASSSGLHRGLEIFHKSAHDIIGKSMIFGVMSQVQDGLLTINEDHPSAESLKKALKSNEKFLTRGPNGEIITKLAMNEKGEVEWH